MVGMELERIAREKKTRSHNPDIVTTYIVTKKENEAEMFEIHSDFNSKCIENSEDKLALLYSFMKAYNTGKIQ
jgi:hypothetical protein